MNNKKRLSVGIIIIASVLVGYVLAEAWPTIMNAQLFRGGDEPSVDQEEEYRRNSTYPINLLEGEIVSANIAEKKFTIAVDLEKIFIKTPTSTRKVTVVAKRGTNFLVHDEESGEKTTTTIEEFAPEKISGSVVVGIDQTNEHILDRDVFSATRMVKVISLASQ